jgi:YD repeat-containing protein
MPLRANSGFEEENRLAAVQCSAAWRTEFRYDALGRLRQRLEYTPELKKGAQQQPAAARGGGGWTLHHAVSYIYDGWRVIQERDTDNTPTVSYTRGNDLSGSLEGAGGIGGLLARSQHSTTPTLHSFYHADGNGNITCLISTNQSVVASYRYDPFGTITAQSGSLADANTYRFSTFEVRPRLAGLVRLPFAASGLSLCLV